MRGRLDRSNGEVDTALYSVEYDRRLTALDRYCSFTRSERMERCRQAWRFPIIIDPKEKKLKIPPSPVCTHSQVTLHGRGGCRLEKATSKVPSLTIPSTEMPPGLLKSPASPASPAPVSHPMPADPHPSADQALLATLSSSSHVFLQPPPSLHAATLVLAKRYLDPLATSASEAQEQRLQDARKKRKRGEANEYDSQRILRLKQVYVEGFGIEQIWEQARRVLDASRQEVERQLPRTPPVTNGKDASHESANGRDVREGLTKVLRFDEDGSEEDESDEDVDADFPNAGMEDELAEDALEEVLDGERTDEGEADAEMIDQEDLASDEDPGAKESELDDRPSEVFVPDKNGLNDGFFSIDDFNRQSEFLEQQDARGEPDAPSDADEIDWDADPQTSALATDKGRILENHETEADLDEDGDGPAFGNSDLDASDSDPDASEAKIQMEDLGSMANTNSIQYADFFEPPPRKATKSRRRALPKTQPPPAGAETEEDLQRTISAVRRDIFEDSLTPDEDASSDAGADTDPRSRRSNHQKRQAAVAAEIRRLEAASIAKRDWTLSGEARAADRPINSLLEEDLEFERAGKPIPVITNEVSEDIEALIKRRILARDFDEVIRRRPGNLATGAGKDVRRGRIELDDTKPQQSLAEVYEAEHLKKVDPEGYVDQKDEKLKAEEGTIERLWKDVCAKLDALSNWHYRPKPAQANINVIADVPTISMEDARPSAGGDIGGASMLAPQEVYKPGEAGVDKSTEVVLKSGMPVGREEMSREDKLRRRRRAKERIRKAGGFVEGPAENKGAGAGVGAGRKAKQKEVVSDLKKGGVRVIGKKGELRDVEGKAVKEKGRDGKAAGALKL